MLWGPNEEYLESLITETFTPPALVDKPKIPSYLQDIYRAYQVLDQTRTFGYSKNPVSLQEMREYIDIFGIGVSKEIFIRLILGIDLEYIGYCNDTSRSAPNSNS